MRHRSGSSPLTRGKRERLAHVGRRRRLIPAHAGKTRHTWERSQSRPAHPRSRGENLAVFAGHAASGGSSPLTRGKRLSSLSLWGPLGLIPAHAGKTHTYWHRVGPRSAHPRSRGENSPAIPSLFRRSGSSPLTRGKPRRGDKLVDAGRLIPAHAGKTLWGRFRRLVRPAHPRSRGENAVGPFPAACAAGSSPLTRGKRVLQGDKRVQVGLIPAHAGKTSSRPPGRRRRPAHPRSRGENSGSPFPARCAWGSSPLTRGKHPPEIPPVARARLIPAHAGKTSGGIIVCHAFPAHPRSRGENRLGPACLGRVWGSSPLTRGKLVCGGDEWVHDGLIPAHAGKTVARVNPGITPPAHPRSRGENAWCASLRPSMLGSSPLTRGKPTGLMSSVPSQGLIPAHAGKTDARQW